MTDKQNNDVPSWIVFDKEREINILATLKNIPNKYDKNIAFFREVPEWFEAGVEGLDEIRNILAQIDDLTELEKKRFSEDDLRQIKNRLTKIIFCNELMANKDVTADQKEVLRCLCYWFSLAVLGMLPFTEEEESRLF